MNFKGISFYLGLSCYPITFLSFFNILYSSYSDHYLNLDSYILTLFISFLIGIALYMFSKEGEKNIEFFEKLVLIFLVYLLVSLLISIPYYFSSYQFSFIDSLFEAMSGLTTTGFTVLYNVKFLDPTLIIWRSSSHWIGGFLFLIFLILIFSNFKKEYKLTHLIYNPDKSTNLFKDTKKIIIKVFFIYSFLTALIFIFFALSGIRLFNSFNLAMTISSTGAFLPTNELSEIIKYPSQKIILTIGLIFSALNVYFFYSLFGNNTIKKHYEDVLILLAVIFFSLLLFFLIQKISFLNILFAVASSLSNSGLATFAPPENFYLFFIFLTIIGGSIISNSSGIKILRLYILFKSTVLEIFKLVSPNTINDQRILKTEHKINNENLNSSFFIFICFFISVFILSSVLTAGGLNFEKSFKLSVLTITNTVNSSLFGLKDINFFNLLTSSKIFIILFMVIGKIELISLFLIIKKIFSRK
jgi:trk system potassium uptake protein TrkH